MNISLLNKIKLFKSIEIKTIFSRLYQWSLRASEVESYTVSSGQVPGEEYSPLVTLIFDSKLFPHCSSVAPSLVSHTTQEKGLAFYFCKVIKLN